MKRNRLIASVLAGTLILLFLFGAPTLLLPHCPLVRVRAQENACLAQESTLAVQQLQIQELVLTSAAQELQIRQFQSTLSVQEAQMRQLVRTDVARERFILELQSTLAVAAVAETPQTPETETAVDTPLAGEWSSTAEGDCLQTLGSITVAIQDEQLILTTDLASATYDRIAPGIYEYEQSTDTYTLQSALTVIDPRHMEVQTTNIVGGETYTCLVQMELTTQE